jgi:very-short-patch-repair endonuclease
VASTIDRVIAEHIAQRGWRLGTTLENRVARLLSSFRFAASDVEQELEVGRWRLDFAWPKIKLCLEADGWHHRSPEGAAHDAERDASLRADGWLVLRVDDRNGEESLADQVARVAQVVRSLDGWI